MPAGGIPEQQTKNTKTSTQNTNKKNAQTDKQKQNQKNTKNQSNKIEISQNILDGATIASTGIGGMELAQGLSEQQSDKDADKDMNAYVETFRCTYGDGKTVKAGPEEIVLPGGNDAELKKLRDEYFALAADLRTRKEALNMQPGIEAQVVLDKSEMGLYDDEFVGITGGAYESVYRAQKTNSQSDTKEIKETKEASQNRVIGGAVALGGGIAGGTIINKINDAINTSEPDKQKNQQNKRRKNEKIVCNTCIAGNSWTGMYKFWSRRNFG